MDNDLIQLLIYALIILAGVVANAIKNIRKKQQSAATQHIPKLPQNLPADPGRDFGPDFGPLMELFDIPQNKRRTFEFETVEAGPSVEEAGMRVDTEEASSELAGMSAEADGTLIEKPEVQVSDNFEEGQSDIQKMIARYEAVRKELDKDSVYDDIAAGEITSEEIQQERISAANKGEQYFNPRKAIIYSEILKRKEY